METNLIISLGTNLGDKKENLKTARDLLSRSFLLIEASSIVSSKAVDYIDQPDFYNQILHFKINTHEFSPEASLAVCLNIENTLGRVRNISKGPRVIDIDILFYGFSKISTPKLKIPHAEMFKRSFIIEPLKTLKVFNCYNDKFNFPSQFNNSCRTLFD